MTALPTGTFDTAADMAEVDRLTRPLSDETDVDDVAERLADARHVLIGEASHGTSEYYRWRAAISRRLIAEHGFSFVAVEGDWPDCFGVNCWVKDALDGGDELDAADVLQRFDRWPTWMWANVEVADFITWLRAHNRSRESDVGFFGLDVYSLWESLDRIVRYVDDGFRDALESTLMAVRCFEPYGEDPQRYAFSTRLVPEGCEHEVVELLGDLRRLTERSTDGRSDDFDALQNAEVIAGAERYYRAMIRADENSWNVRDHHMADTFDRLIDHHGPGSRGIVWAHNTHVGDARATDMAAAGMTNVGQIARERLGRDTVALVGFGGYEGTVVAGRRWGTPWEVMPVPEARPESHEGLIRRATDEPVVLLAADDRTGRWLTTPRAHRAIGVVYEPGRDRRGNWVPTVIGDRYDVFIEFASTSALSPLHVERRASDEMETLPWGT